MPGPALDPGTQTPVAVIDPQGSGTTVATLQVSAAGQAELVDERPQQPGETTPELFISPGWVDLHAHVYDGTTQISVHPDRVGLDHGVHTVADAGSAGQATLRGLIDYVIPSARTQIKAWLNIGSHGLVHLREVADSTFIDVPATVAAVASAPDVVRGIKVRSSGLIVGNMGLQPLQLGKLAARECGIPLMVHIGEAPPLIDDVLDLLDEGDVVTHCFHGKTGFPWAPDGQPSAAMRRAIDRGVKLDVGHGAASFDITVAGSAVAAGVTPSSISTDIHVRNINGPVFDLATVMTKMLTCGMSLAAVVRAVTEAPRETLRLVEPWRGDGGRLHHATLFTLGDEAPEGRRYVDAGGKPITPTQHLVAQATVTAGTPRPCP
ncbi:amidohydrolase/deacetylase family metallohydrolase [Aeromicrobium chenweiae]|uniref:amidohydrolase/deacetylase family metallohydrolase n=1 Tax=Aeromicrobium chenweiae TaxID=2079793 RepID=UPI00131EE0E7|nr:amidohydrolase/deacetylase family metallohydrolase [Aeromicrobium chenweiae]